MIHYNKYKIEYWNTIIISIITCDFLKINLIKKDDPKNKSYLMVI